MRPLIITPCLVASILVVFVIASLITGFTLVIPVLKIEVDPAKSVTFVKGDTIRILKNADLSSGKWSAYLSLSRADMEDLHPSIESGSCLKTTDLKVIRCIKDNWIFTFTGADIATVESSIFIFRDGKLIFKSGIVLDKHQQGLQSADFGWVYPSKPGILTEPCRKFKKVYWPVIFL